MLIAAAVALVGVLVAWCALPAREPVTTVADEPRRSNDEAEAQLQPAMP